MRDEAPTSGPADQLPRHTTPTWEMELLISGAAIVGMVQVPGWLAAHLLPLVSRFVTDVGVPLRILYMYLGAAAVILAVTFALHLALRAYWIALVGAHSVFPRGVRWDRLNLGPIARDTAQRRDPGAAAAIERADNRASIVFAFGIAMALSLLVLSLALFVALIVAMLVAHVTGAHVNALDLFFIVVGAWLVIRLLAIRLDRRFGTRLREGGLPRRWLAGALSFYARTGGLRGSSSPATVLESQVGTRRFALLSSLVIVPVILGVLASVALRSAPVPLGDYGWFPRLAADDPRVLTSAHYDDERDPLRAPAVPYIPSEVATGAYLPLVVPYVPARDSPAMGKTCTAATHATGHAARADALLGCLTALHGVWLDGKPLPALHYDVTRDPRTDRPALQAMIDVRALDPGRHVLRIARAPAPEGSHRRDDPGNAWTIAFWR